MSIALETFRTTQNETVNENNKIFTEWPLLSIVPGAASA